MCAHTHTRSRAFFLGNVFDFSRKALPIRGPLLVPCAAVRKGLGEVPEAAAWQKEFQPCR